MTKPNFNPIIETMMVGRQCWAIMPNRFAQLVYTVFAGKGGIYHTFNN